MIVRQRGAFLTHSERETIEFACRLGAGLCAGAVVLLSGELGTGKTAFVRGLAEGLGIDPDEVSSPTFTLIHEYHGRLTLYHADLYRLSEREAGELGLEELASGQGVVAIEWAEKLPLPIRDAIEVRIVYEGGDDREITIAAPTRPDSSVPLV